MIDKNMIEGGLVIFLTFLIFRVINRFITYWIGKEAASTKQSEGVTNSVLALFQGAVQQLEVAVHELTKVVEAMSLTVDPHAAEKLRVITEKLDVMEAGDKSTNVKLDKILQILSVSELALADTQPLTPVDD